MDTVLPRHHVNIDTTQLTLQESKDRENYSLAYPILESEVRDSIQILNTGRSLGYDNLSEELLKSGDVSLIKLVT